MHYLDCSDSANWMLSGTFTQMFVQLAGRCFGSKLILNRNGVPVAKMPTRKPFWCILAHLHPCQHSTAAPRNQPRGPRFRSQHRGTCATWPTRHTINSSYSQLITGNSPQADTHDQIHLTFSSYNWLTIDQMNSLAVHTHTCCFYNHCSIAWNIKSDRSVHAYIVTKHNIFIITPTSTLQAEHRKENYNSWH